MRKIRVNVLSQLPFVVKHMVVWRDSLIVLSEMGMLYEVEIIDE